MSPVRTTTRSVLGKVSSVRSSRLVLPEPGELIRFRQRIPCSRKRSRNSVAIRSFSLRTFFSRGTRFIFVYLHVGQLQFVAADAFTREASALRTLEVIVADGKFSRAVQTLMPSLAGFDREFQPLHVRVLYEHLEAESQRLGIDSRQFANLDSDLARLCS